jgi:hypothetical protein
MKQTVYLIIGCLFFSCQAQKQITGPSFSSIKGGWKGTIKNAGDYYNHNRWLWFEDSLCTDSQMWWSNDLTYYINHDTILINSTDKYAILKLTSDSLVLLSAASNGKPADTVVLNKIHKKNTIKPSVIYFASSACFGTCPEMYLEIDAGHNVAFYGVQFTEKEGGFRCKISAAEYKTILNQINNLPVDSLKDYYSELGSDAQTRGVAIESAGKLIKSTAYGTYSEPVELNILLNKLMNIYQYLPLQADTTVTRDYFLKRPTNDLIFYPMKKED